MTSREDQTPLIVYGLIIVIIGIFTAMGIFGWQVYFYLKSGDWISVSVIDALNWLKVEWANNPQSWFGLHKLLIKTHLSLAVFFVSLFLFWVTTTKE